MIINKSNKKSSKKAIILEFYNYHIECIYPQVVYLTNGGFDVELVCSKEILQNIEYLRSKCKIIGYDFNKLTSYIKVWFYLLKNKKSTLIILNTAQGNKVLKFIILPFLSRFKIFGIIHNIKKLEESKGQKIITKKISKYFVISEYLKESSISKKYGISSINTSLFPAFVTESIKHKGNEIWITIPGNIEKKRRDYDWLIDFSHSYNLDKRIKFILLGNAKKGDGNEIIRKIKLLKMENKFIWFESYITQDTFNNYIESSDYLLPLLNENNKEYLYYKVSGAFTLSEAFAKPMILHSNFYPLDKYYCCLFYKTDEEFLALISKISIIKCKKTNFERNGINYLKAFDLTE